MDKYLKLYLPKSKEEIREIWQESIFILDTNILLNLYRYTKGTREGFFNILNVVNEKTWIPHQVAIEYLSNRTKVIFDQGKDFEEQSRVIEEGKSAAIEKIKEKLNSTKKPFRKIDLEEIESKVDHFFNGLKKEMVDNNKNKVDFNGDDIILKKILGIYKGKIGNAYNKEELKTLYSDGETRYKEQLPPGYEDLEEKKGEYRVYKDTKIKSEYGDLIVWKQIIDKAVKDNKSVVFITDDRKSDWWKIENGQIKGPREELINEFFNETARDFLMYSTESFLKNAKNILNVEIQDETIQEVHDYARVRKSFNNRSVRSADKSVIDERFNEKNNYVEILIREIEFYSRDLAALENKISQRKEDSINLNRNAKKYNVYDRDKYLMKLEELEKDIFRLVRERSHYKRKITELKNELLSIDENAII